MAMIRDRFDRNFREERFSRVLSDFVDNNSTFAKMTGFGQIYQYASNFASIWNNIFIEPIRDTLLRTPSHKIYSENKYSLFHYDVPGNKTTLEEEAKETQRKEKTSAPVLIIYAFINRHYILDLVPGSSIVHNLQKHGLDMFATDWGNPSAYDKNLTLGHYVNNYLVDAIDEITKHTVADKYPCSATAGAEIWR
jgi:polyhydroxyalkanoate synthase